MKKICAALIAAALFMALFTGCAVARKNVLYFGYFGDDEQLIENVGQAENANLMFVSDSGYFELVWRARLNSIYRLPARLFSADGGALHARWESIYERIMPIDYKSIIFGICIDQAYTNGLSEDELNVLINRLKQDFPESKIILREDASALAGIAEYAKNADVVLAEFEQTPTGADITAAAASVGAASLWLKVPDQGVSDVYNCASNVEGLIVDTQSVSDEQILVGKSIMENGATPKYESNAKYFGYYHSGGFANSRDFFDEIGAMHNSNVAFVETPQQIESCLANNMAPIVSFYKLLIGNQEDWEDRYAAFRAEVDDHIDDIFAFYADEPSWNGIPKDSFRAVTQRLRQDYPQMRVFAVLALGELSRDNAAEYFEFCTDLGYDTYKRWDLQERLKEMQLLKDTAAFDQNLWLITWSFQWGFASKYTDEQEDTLIRDIENNYILSAYEPRVVGILNFTYASSNVGQWEGDWGTGFRDLVPHMPNLYQTHLRIGQEIIKR